MQPLKRHPTSYIALAVLGQRGQFWPFVQSVACNGLYGPFLVCWFVDIVSLLLVVVRVLGSHARMRKARDDGKYRTWSRIPTLPAQPQAQVVAFMQVIGD